MKNIEPKAIKLFLISSWSAFIPLASYFLMGFINSNSEKLVFQESMILLGMFGFPMVVLISGLLFLSAFIAGLSASTPKTLLLSVLGTIVVISFALELNPFSFIVVIPLVTLTFITTWMVYKSKNISANTSVDDSQNENSQ